MSAQTSELKNSFKLKELPLFLEEPFQNKIQSINRKIRIIIVEKKTLQLSDSVLTRTRMFQTF